MKHQKAIDAYVAAKRTVQRLEATDPADMPDREYHLKQAKQTATQAIRLLTGGDLAVANRILATPPTEGN